MPVKSDVILYTGLSALQKNLYKAILTKDMGECRLHQRKLFVAYTASSHSSFAAAFGEAGSKTRLMNILVQLRKCVNHPYLFDGVEPEPFELGEHLVTASGKKWEERGGGGEREGRREETIIIIFPSGKLFLIDKLLSLLKSQ